MFEREKCKLMEQAVKMLMQEHSSGTCIRMKIIFVAAEKSSTFSSY